MLRRTSDDFDAEQELLACANGIINLQTGKLMPLERDHYTIKNTGLPYDPDFKHDKFDKFIKTACNNDNDLIEYMQMAAGYSLTGSNEEECFFIVSGPAQTGKSTFMDGMHSMLGSYHASTQSDTFMYRRNQSTGSNELARLAGVRAVTMSEIREGDSFNDAVVKQVTSGDIVTARHLYKDTFEFTPRFKLWIATNHDPAARDEALWRRIRKIPFDRIILAHERDKDLKKMMRDPMTGGKAMLTWAVQGAIKWFKCNELVSPTAVVEQTKLYRRDEDRLGQFISEYCSICDNGYESLANDVYAAYKRWCIENTESTKSRAVFSKQLKDRGHVQEALPDGRVVYTSIALKPHIKANIWSGDSSWS